MVDLFMNIIQFLFFVFASFSLGWGLRDIYVNLKSYLKGDL